MYLMWEKIVSKGMAIGFAAMLVTNSVAITAYAVEDDEEVYEATIAVNNIDLSRFNPPASAPVQEDEEPSGGGTQDADEPATVALTQVVAAQTTPAQTTPAKEAEKTEKDNTNVDKPASTTTIPEDDPPLDPAPEKGNNMALLIAIILAAIAGAVGLGEVIRRTVTNRV